MIETASADTLHPSMLLRLREQESRAWDEFVGVFSPLVYGWCLQRRVPHADAEEISQEVFRKVLLNLDRFRRDRPGDSFRGWLWTITRNTQLDFAKRQREKVIGGSTWNDHMHGICDPYSDTDFDVESEAPPPRVGKLYKRVMKIVEPSISEKRWKAFLAVVVDARPAGEVALELGMSRNAVYVARSTIMKRLRNELGEPDA